MKEWIITTSALVGQSHIPKAIPCQDSTHYLQDNGVTVMALSDGCGSSKLSHVGSKITVETLCDVLTKSFDALLKMDAVQSREFILNAVVDRLKAYVDENEDVTIKDLNATFLFVAVNEADVALMGHIGDGYIGAVDKKKLVIKSLEKKTGEVNGTVYPTSSHATYFLQLKRGNAKNIDAFVMMSDGSGDGLVDSRVPFVKKFAPHVAGIIEYMGDHSDEENQTFMDKLITRVRDHIFSGDDCSLAIMCLPKVKIEAIEPYALEKPDEEETTEDPKTIEDVASELKIVESVYYYFKENDTHENALSKDEIEQTIKQLKKGKTIEDLCTSTALSKDRILQIEHVYYELNSD